jgi:hypothetical protein
VKESLLVGIRFRNVLVLKNSRIKPIILVKHQILLYIYVLLILLRPSYATELPKKAALFHMSRRLGGHALN